MARQGVNPGGRGGFRNAYFFLIYGTNVVDRNLRSEDFYVCGVLRVGGLMPFASI